MSDQSKIGLGIEDIISDKRDAILRLANQYGASNVRVFGSVARGEAREDSDIDFLVSIPPKTSIFELVGLWLDLTELMGREVDLVTEDDRTDRFMSNALKDAVNL